MERRPSVAFDRLRHELVGESRMRLGRQLFWVSAGTEVVERDGVGIAL